MFLIVVEQLNNVVAGLGNPGHGSVVQVARVEERDLPVPIAIVTVVGSRVNREIIPGTSCRLHIERVELFCTNI